MSVFLLLALLIQAPRDAATLRPPTRGTAAIGGTVTTGGAGAKRALARAIVSLSGTGITGVRQVVTDDSGRFAFDDVAAGRFTLVSKSPAI